MPKRESVMAETGIQLDRRQLMLGSATIALASSFGLTACGRNLPVLALDGRVVTRDAPEFEQWRTGVIWQSRKPDRKPSLIVRPNSTAAIAAAVQYARANDLKISVKSAGHHIWGNFLRDDGMLIDMWNFRKVEIDDGGESAWIEPSVWSRDINTAYRAGRTIQAGRVWTNCYHAYPAHAAFGGVVVQFQDAVVEIGAQAFHPGEGVADCSGQRGFSRDRGELQGQPRLEIVEDRGGMCAAEFGAAIWR
jgi:hypothetical protein